MGPWILGLGLWGFSLALSSSVGYVLPRQGINSLGRNTSVLPPGWGVNSALNCMADGNLIGPIMTDPNLTIEICVAFCNEQGQRLAGVIGTQCKCANIFNPEQGGFESDPGNCNSLGFDFPCPGNQQESCGLPVGFPTLISLFQKFGTPIDCSDIAWPGGAALTAGPSGQWRFSYFYNDSTAVHALGVNAVDLQVPLPSENVTTLSCTTACENAGFTLAGVKFGDQCFCGNILENSANTIQSDCESLVPTDLFAPFPVDPARITPMPCAGNANELCGGPNFIAIYMLPGTGIFPLIPFDPAFNNLCANTNCVVRE